MNANGRFLSMDVVFYGGSLNYDQGVSNQQELKKITLYDGSVHILVSRYALRYSILENGEKGGFWKLAGKNQFGLKKQGSEDEETSDEMDQNTESTDLPEDKKSKNDNGVVQVNINLLYGKDKEPEIINWPEFDLFGYFATEKGKGKKNGFSRTAPVKLTHAISLNPYNFDSHFMANLGVTKRAGGSGSNPVTMEEFYGFYVYNITLDLNRIGSFDVNELNGASKKAEITHEQKEKRIRDLIKTILYLKRDIKGKREDLSPLLVIAGVYENTCYDTYMDRVSLANKHETRVMRGKQDLGNGKEEIYYEEQKRNAPVFVLAELPSENIIIYARPDIILKVGEADLTQQESSKTKFETQLHKLLGIKEESKK